MADNVSGGLDFGALQKLPLSVKLCEKIVSGIQNALYTVKVISADHIRVYLNDGTEIDQMVGP